MPKTTPGTTQRTAVAADWALDPADADACERLARTLCTGGHDQVDNPEWVAGARDAWEELPFLLRRGMRRFRRHSGPHGTLVIGGLPVDQAALPATPSVLGSVQRQVSVSAAVLTMVACGLGEPLAYRAEKSGALVQDVVPVPGQETFHGNAGSVPLSFHTENGFHPHPPDYVIFLCLRADHDGIAGMRVAGIRQALPLLTPASRQALFAPEFITTPPPSFSADAATSEPDVKPRPVLSGAAEDPDIRMAQLVTTPLTPRATAALTEFGRACEATARTLRLTPGDLVIIDNRVTVHGRTAFRPRYDGADRWLQRTYVTTDLRRSRDHRPHDGHILTR
ncbi:clavaminate synthase family protein [Streptomyces sp. NBC_01500]|uniref:clavaminate synthase family protein n=1 Tax=Streptomyces sp. NBC_01500 TaxID=2903886 RepID=UPI00224EAAAF|nr:clavaminate synthase family protein [Streptomyces sp. NBC_01500]MCX4553156.1 clavaminate synthase family protein [Streptomyces sp. NBC_01500]